MNAKDKKKRHIKISLKNIIYLCLFFIILLYSIIFYNLYFSKEVFASDNTEINEEKVKISNASEINIEEIIDKNTNNGRKEEISVHEETLEYITKYRTNNKLPKGMVQVVQEGREGKQEITTKKVYEKEQLIEEIQMSSKIKKASVNKIVEVGNGKKIANYNVKVGDKVYVTSDRLSVMSELSENATKVATLAKNDELKVLEINGQWYKIICDSHRGYVKKECTTYLNPNEKEVQNDKNAPSNQGNSTSGSGGNIEKLSFDMKLNKTSGLSLEQFKKILTDDKDKNKIFENNAEYFYYIEKQYNINGVFVAAVAIHESGWGTSKIALQKKNLFGYGAYDSNPYNGAYEFTDYSECIDLIARVFVKYYLNPKRTEIYGGEKAQGIYYNGSTLTAVNTKYASDKNWANSVYKHMKYLYNKL
ncbi:MAG: glucosaminidase domain-containing protein [Clostridium sp.]|nr:glucosaminidase domain-containing protein [Clostridium sp.]